MSSISRDTREAAKRFVGYGDNFPSLKLYLNNDVNSLKKLNLMHDIIDGACSLRGFFETVLEVAQHNFSDSEKKDITAIRNTLTSIIVQAKIDNF